MGLFGWFRAQRTLEEAIGALMGGRLREAAAAFEDYLRAKPNEWEAWSFLGDCYFDLGDLTRAEAALQRSAALNAEGVEAQETLALLYAERDKAWDRCFPLLERCLTQTTDAGIPEVTELKLAWCYYLQGDTARAAQHFELALGPRVDEPLEPDAEAAGDQYRLGLLFHELKQDDARARTHLQNALGSSPESVYARQAKEWLARLGN